MHVAYRMVCKNMVSFCHNITSNHSSILVFDDPVSTVPAFSVGTQVLGVLNNHYTKLFFLARWSWTIVLSKTTILKETFFLNGGFHFNFKKYIIEFA